MDTAVFSASAAPTPAPISTTSIAAAQEEAKNGEEGGLADGKKRASKMGKRRKVNHACLYCRRSHMTCDEGRPCQRW
jgi:hypothetical protein